MFSGLDSIVETPTTYMFRLHESNSEFKNLPVIWGPRKIWNTWDVWCFLRTTTYLLFIFKVLGCISQYSNTGLSEFINKSMLYPSHQSYKIIENHLGFGWGKVSIYQQPTLSVKRWSWIHSLCTVNGPLQATNGGSLHSTDSLSWTTELVETWTCCTKSYGHLWACSASTLEKGHPIFAGTCNLLEPERDELEKSSLPAVKIKSIVQTVFC